MTEMSAKIHAHGHRHAHLHHHLGAQLLHVAFSFLRGIFCMIASEALLVKQLKLRAGISKTEYWLFAKVDAMFSLHRRTLYDTLIKTDAGGVPHV